MSEPEVQGLDEEISYIAASVCPNAVTFFLAQTEEFQEAKEILTQNINPRKYDNYIEGKNGNLKLTETGVRITRTGSLFSGFPPGSKNIPYKNITAVQFKKPDFTVGFIQLTLLGGVEAQGGAFNAVKDENTITFDDVEKIEQVERIKKIIEQRIIEPNHPQKESTNNNELELLEKLASLRDKGIVTEEELLLKKKQILGL